MSSVAKDVVPLGARLRGPDPAFGAWLQMQGAVAAEHIGSVGFDWIGIDRQHGLIDYAGMVGMLQAAAISGTPTIVRVSGNDGAEIGRALDAGAHGVFVPMVESAESARRAVSACRYAPEGERSWGPIRPSIGRTELSPHDEALRAACVVMIETRRGADAVEAIVDVPGVDAVLIGPSDLSVSLGGSPHVTLGDAANRPVVERIVRACRSAGVGVGSLAPSPGHVPEYLDSGCTFVGVHRDIQAMMRAAAAALSSSRETRT